FQGGCGGAGPGAGGGRSVWGGAAPGGRGGPPRAGWPPGRARDRLVPRAPRRGAADVGRARRRAMRVVARPTASGAKTAARLRGKHPITRGLAARIFPGGSRAAARYEIALGRAGLTVVPAVAGLVLASVLAASRAVGGSPGPVASTAAVAFRLARGIEILQNDVGAFTLIGRVLKARCSIGE